MELNVTLVQSNRLFEGVMPEELPALLHCLRAAERDYARGNVIFAAGERATRLGIVLSGRVNTVYGDVLGGSSIMGSIEAGNLFCDAFCCTESQTLPVSIVAQTDSCVLLIEIERILRTCANACAQHRRLSENLVHILAEKYVALNQKLIHLSGRTTRRKLLSYLYAQAKAAGGGAFAIPFNQQELADYLFTDRSGLSTALNLLKKEGILRQEQNGLYSLNASAGCAVQSER